jgi:hypothetical protein
MSEIDVTIVNPSHNSQRPARVPDNVPASDIVRALITQMNLPMQHKGEAVSYRLHHKQSGRILTPQQSLADAGVRAGHVLRLQAELTAGAEAR